MSRFLDALRSGRVLLMDGAMGTELQRAGLQPGECGELWNLTHPEKVRAIHQAYVDAGAEVLLTNTFQANPSALARHNLDGQLAVIWQAAVELAREAAGPDRWVLADVGPPWQFFDVLEALPRLGAALAAAKPDGLIVETCSDLSTPIRMLKAFAPRTLERPPVLISLAYRHDRTGGVRTIHGQRPCDLAERAEKVSGVAGIGANCGRDIAMPQVIEVVEAYHRASHLRVFARPNAGTPKQVEDRWVYPHSPEYMASWLPELLEAGVSMVGGCCGTTPAHIAAFRSVVDEWNRTRCR
jgi:5-methyltetrahydrofolate--homocysteine methyltransferase